MARKDREAKEEVKNHWDGETSLQGGSSYEDELAEGAGAVCT
jgi:hypothetical protein